MAVDYTQRSVTGSNAGKTEELSLLRRGAGMRRQRRLLLSIALGCPVLMITWSLFTPRTFTTTGSFLPQSPDQSASPLVGLAAQFGVVGSADHRS